MRAFVGLAARAVPVLLVVTGGLVAVQAGVDVSQRPGLPTDPLLVQLYYVFGLFVLGGLDLGVPTGGPAWARALLWICYFAGPAITTSAVAEGVVRLAQPRWIVRLWNRGHTVVVGDGPVARAYAAVVRARGHRLSVVPPEVLGDPAAREDLALGQARAVVLISGNDLWNLDQAWELARVHVGLAVACHVAEIGLRRRATAPARGSGVQMFNSHEAAAASLFASTLAPHFASTEENDAVVLIGFGRFGQTVLRYVQEHGVGDVDRAILVDRGAERLLRMFREHEPIDPSVACTAVDGDIRDPATWDAVAAALDTHARPVVLLCTDDEGTNLQAAIGLRQRLPQALLYVRHFADSSFVRALEQEHRLEGVPLERVLKEALAARYAALTGLGPSR